MILVHRIKGEQMYLNADLIESIESTPDTLITLVDGRKVVVADTPATIIDRIRTFRASILAAAEDHRSGQEASLIVLPSPDDDRP